MQIILSRYKARLLAMFAILNPYAPPLSQNKPLVFTDPNADPRVCAECHKTFSDAVAEQAGKPV